MVLQSSSSVRNIMSGWLVALVFRQAICVYLAPLKTLDYFGKFKRWTLTMAMTMMRKSACRCRVSALQGRAGSALATWAPPAAGTGRCDREEEEEEGESVHYLPRRWTEGAPRVSGFSPKTPATPGVLNQPRTWLDWEKVKWDVREGRREGWVRTWEWSFVWEWCECKPACDTGSFRPVARPTTAQLSKLERTFYKHSNKAFEVNST